MKAILNKMTFGHPKQIIKPAVWIFFEDFFNLFPALIVYIAINMIAESFDQPEQLDLGLLSIVSGILILLAVIQFFVGWKAFKNSFSLSAKYIAEDRIDYVKKLRRLPLGFFSKKATGELIKNFSSDFVNIQSGMTGYFSGLFSVLTSCVLTSVFMFIYNPIMAIAFYLAIPITVVILVFSLKTLERNAYNVAIARDDTASHLNEYLGGMKTLKNYNQTGEGFSKLKASYHQLMTCCIKEEGGSGSLMRLCTTIVQFGLPLLCIACGYLLLGGSIGIVEFVGITIIGTKILTPVVVSISHMMILRANYVSAKRLDQVMKADEMTGKPETIKHFEMAFDQVSFSYLENSELALDDVSFTVPEGKFTAIVGPSGSGKSTILRLIARFWDVSEGAIYCDDHLLSDIAPEDWQHHVSMVLQDVYLFHETIRENIMFGRKDATEEDMIDASKKAGCHDFIMALPDQYDTLVGEGGSTLSGGEKQRVSIARAILKKAPVLLLDEPTASLDAKNELLIQRAIDALVKDTTVVMIAHRLKTVMHADQILVLEDGKIIERGKHETLLNQKGLYSKLWQMQASTFDWNFSK